MSVREMRQLLGLGKTDSYWLVHQGFFETIKVNGKMRVVIDSFEHWYSMQTKHRKVTGEEPGSKLHEETLSAKEIAKLLGICTQQASVLIRQENLPYVKVHSQFQVPKDAFERWYESQTHYVTERVRTASLKGKWLSLPRIGTMIGKKRSTAYSIVNSAAGREALETVRLGNRTYVKAASFERWLAGQKKYQLVPERKLCKVTRKVNKPGMQLCQSKNPNYYTVEEVCRIYGMRHSELYEKLQSGDIPALRIGTTWRIKRTEFDELLQERSEE